MLNAEAITAMSAKFAAALSRAAGTEIPPITVEEIQKEMAGERRIPLLRYHKACLDLAPEAHRELTPLGLDARYVQGVESFLDALTHFSLYIRASLRDDENADEELTFMPPWLLPDAPSGKPRAARRRQEAEEVLTAAYAGYASEETGEFDFDQKMLDRLVRKVALRFVPADFVPQTQSTRAAESERALAGWAALHRRRDDIVREAFDAGVPKTRIHELTGLSRSTIDRLLRREGSDQTC